MVVSAAVEGPTDEVALRKICQVSGVLLGTVYGRNGKQWLLDRIRAYNNSAKYRHWVVMVDLDSDFDCAPTAVGHWLPHASKLMCFRVAVHELESWLLADRERISAFLGVPLDRIPFDPDLIADPKLELINIARGSSKRALREDIVPEPGAGQPVGPAYTARIIEFISMPDVGWRPEVAAQNSLSLSRCIASISRLISRPYP